VAAAVFFQNILFDLFIIGLFIIVVYSFTVLPRQRDFKQRQKMVSQLKPGTEVITYGGLIGTVISIQPEKGLATLEIANGVQVRVISQAISAELDTEGLADSVKNATR
jgi:preprotein translocase subunit YajC